MNGTFQDSSRIDVHSFAQPTSIRVRHCDLDLTVDFQRQQLMGSATLSLERINNLSELTLDTRQLDIQRVECLDAAGTPTATEFSLGDEDPEQPYLGRCLTVPLQEDTVQVRIQYRTQPDAAALQWLTPDQTAGKRRPFLYTQSQAILARTWVPCQDTPAVRFTYSAKLQVPADMMAVMSATNPTSKSIDGKYTFEMRQPIPSYLLALAVGDISFRAIGKRTGVYAEPATIEDAAYEFADTERMLVSAEKLYGPYRWEQYDIIVLPPSFPFGGMENPRLTFATPTILAGDRSLVSLIAHELAHSWSGNLVTNATWDDFWLNEGFTVYFEHRIMEKVFGRDYDEMLALLGKRGLERELATLPARDTWLKLDLAGRDPDDGMTDIAYEKGYLFLRGLEETVGREPFDAFLRAYFDAFAFQSVTTEQFVDYLKSELISKHNAESFDVERWIYGPGLPPNCPEIQTSMLADVESCAKEFAEDGPLPPATVTKQWTTHHWLHFLRSLQRPLTLSQMATLDDAYQLSQSGNSEVLHDWLLHAVAADYQPAMETLEAFLTGQGRRKFLVPLYRAMLESDQGVRRARRIYGRARAGYHPVSQQTIDKMLEWPSSTGGEG